MVKVSWSALPCVYASRVVVSELVPEILKLGVLTRELGVLTLELWVLYVILHPCWGY